MADADGNARSREEDGAGNIDMHSAPVISDSDALAPLDNDPLKRLGAIIERGPGKLRLRGPGYRETALPAGTRGYNLAPLSSEH